MSGQPHSDAKRMPQSTNLNMKHRRYDYKSEPEIGSQLQEHKQKKKKSKVSFCRVESAILITPEQNLFAGCFRTVYIDVKQLFMSKANKSQALYAVSTNHILNKM